MTTIERVLAFKDIRFNSGVLEKLVSLQVETYDDSLARVACVISTAWRPVEQLDAAAAKETATRAVDDQIEAKFETEQRAEAAKAAAAVDKLIDTPQLKTK